MKICKYCGAENIDSSSVCSSCSGNEFKHKCCNCGTVFEDGYYCPKCGVKVGTEPKKCRNCGAEYYSVACPNCGHTSTHNNASFKNASTPVQSNRKKKTWLWVLGWIFIFPVPLTILMVRNHKLSKRAKICIIAVSWIIYLIIAYSGNSDSTATNANGGLQYNQSSELSSASEKNIKKLSFSSDKDVTLKVGQKNSSGYLNVTVKSRSRFTPEDVVFVSDDPAVAMISFSHDALTTNLYYEIIGVGAGETNVYATSKDGSIASEKLKVTVLAPIEVTGITVNPEKTVLYLGEKTTSTVSILPTDAEDKTLTWSSSDTNIATVDDKGLVTAISSGTVTITVSASNGVSSSFDLNVDGSKRMMNLRITHPRQDDYNIGDEWSYITELNGEQATGSVAVSVGDKLTFHAKITESDDNPDVGEASTYHTVTEEDMQNGFTVTIDLYVRENGGKNRGKSAYFIVTYSFTP